MKISDVHVHLHMYNLEDGTKFFDTLHNKNVTHVNIVTATLTSANLYEAREFENTYGLWMKREYKKSELYVYGGIHEVGAFKDVPYVDQLKYLLKAGCDGVKFLNMKPNIRKAYGRGINDSCYDELFSAMEEMGVPALIHSKDPESFWHKELMLPEHIEYGWCYDGEGFISFEETHKETLERLDKNPNLKVILAHVFFMDEDLKEANRVMEKYPNVCLDLAPHTGMFESFSKDVEGWREFFIKYQDRIMFGSDADDRRDQQTIDEIYDVVYTSMSSDDSEKTLTCYDMDWHIRGLSLPEDVLNKIFHDNFIKFMDGKRNEVNNELLINMAEKAYEKLKTIPGHPDTEIFKYFLDLNK